MTTVSFQFKMTPDGRFTDVREVRMTKLEQVARAIYEADGSAEDGYLPTLYGPMARAAVEALREPTEAMLNSGWQALPDVAPTKGDCATEDALMIDIWQEMIDAALGIERDRRDPEREARCLS